MKEIIEQSDLIFEELLKFADDLTRLSIADVAAADGGCPQIRVKQAATNDN